MKIRAASIIFILFVQFSHNPFPIDAATVPVINPGRNDIVDSNSPPAAHQPFLETPLSESDEWYNRAYNRLWNPVDKQVKRKKTFIATPTFNFKNRSYRVLPDPKKKCIWFYWKTVNFHRVRIDIYEISGERIASLHQQQPQQKISWHIGDLPAGIFYYRLTFINKKKTALPLQKIVIFR
ncbi:hypothetical protein K8S19_13600 [bacterium]|nr:hypothetical protein [bacterium]